jgi:hypothetical protein
VGEIWSLTGNILAGVALVIVFGGFLSMLGSASVGGVVTETKDGNTPRWMRHRLLVSVAGMLIVAVGHWFIYGRVHPLPGDVLVGVLEMNARTHTATARLHNRGPYVIDQVLLDVWSGPRTKDGGSISNADQRGSYRCGERLGAGPGASFSCDFIYPFDTGDDHSFGWSITQSYGRPRDPLGIYD